MSPLCLNNLYSHQEQDFSMEDSLNYVSLLRCVCFIRRSASGNKYSFPDRRLVCSCWFTVAQASWSARQTHSSDPVIDLSCFGIKPNLSRQEPVKVTAVPRWISPRALEMDFTEEIYWKQGNVPVCLGPCFFIRIPASGQRGVRSYRDSISSSRSLSPNTHTHTNSDSIMCLFHCRLLRRLLLPSLYSRQQRAECLC